MLGTRSVNEAHSMLVSTAMIPPSGLSVASGASSISFGGFFFFSDMVYRLRTNEPAIECL